MYEIRIEIQVPSYINTFTKKPIQFHSINIRLRVWMKSLDNYTPR